MEGHEDNLVWAVVKAVFSILGVAIYVVVLRLRGGVSGARSSGKAPEREVKPAAPAARVNTPRAA